MFILPRRALKSLLLALCLPALALALAQPAPAAAPIKVAMTEGLSGPFANTGEAVYRNLIWAVERVNARGGVKFDVAGSGYGFRVIKTLTAASAEQPSSCKMQRPAQQRPDRMAASASGL